MGPVRDWATRHSGTAGAGRVGAVECTIAESPVGAAMIDPAFITLGPCQLRTLRLR